MGKATFKIKNYSRARLKCLEGAYLKDGILFLYSTFTFVLYSCMLWVAFHGSHLFSINIFVGLEVNAKSPPFCANIDKEDDFSI